VRQIIFNLIGNALKFTEQGEIRISCIAENKGEDAVRITLSVRDTGIGIPLDLQEKVFQAFTQVDTSTTRKHQGSGLGLGIVRHLTEHMNGSVSLESEPGRGTNFICRLPFAIAGAAAAPPPPDCGKDAVKRSGYPALTVIIAEDDAVSRLAMRLFLERLGHRVVCAANGREALEALRVYPFDCLITDVRMPEMDGIEVTRHIRDGEISTAPPSQEVVSLVAGALPGETVGAKLYEVPRDLPIIAVSAHAMKGDKEFFLEEGMNYYLSKPLSLKDLDAMLRRVYESHIRPAAHA
jgi:CheY-like chemotaxis protein/anti-sigma regulatory factor (Ser/Thr protein kinase)